MHGIRQADNTYRSPRKADGTYHDDGAVQCADVCPGGPNCLMKKGASQLIYSFYALCSILPIVQRLGTRTALCMHICLTCVANI